MYSVQVCSKNMISSKIQQEICHPTPFQLSQSINDADAHQPISHPCLKECHQPTTRETMPRLSRSVTTDWCILHSERLGILQAIPFTDSLSIQAIPFTDYLSTMIWVGSNLETLSWPIWPYDIIWPIPWDKHIYRHLVDLFGKLYIYIGIYLIIFIYTVGKNTSPMDAGRR